MKQLLSDGPVVGDRGGTYFISWLLLQCVRWNVKNLHPGIDSDESNLGQGGDPTSMKMQCVCEREREKEREGKNHIGFGPISSTCKLDALLRNIAKFVAS